LNIVECCKYLGILIDSDLKWQDHINYIYNKLIKFTSIFYKIRTKLPEEVLRMIYFAFVHSHLSYGIEVYANTTANHLSKLNVLNNRLLRIIQKKSIKHIIMIYIKVTLLFLYSYFISLIFYYLCIIMFTIGINYQWYFPRIMRKIK